MCISLKCDNIPLHYLHHVYVTFLGVFLRISVTPCLMSRDDSVDTRPAALCS